MMGDDDDSEIAQASASSQAARHDVDVKVGQRLTSLRTAVGLTTNELANLVGLDEEDLLEIERGERRPSARVLVAIAHALDCSVASFFVDE